MSRKDRAPRARKPRELKRALRLSPDEIARDERALAVLAAWARRDARAARLHARGEDRLRRRRAQEALRVARRRDRRPAEAVRAAFDAPEPAGAGGHAAPGREPTGWAQDVAMLARRFDAGTPERRSLQRLLEVVAARSSILHCRDTWRLLSLTNLAREASRWIRAPEDWRCTARHPADQLSSLIAHLNARHPVPRVLDAAFSWTHQRNWLGWYRHVGDGASIRSAADLPFPVSRRAAGWFARAPLDLDPDEALRFAQVRAFGGTEAQARALADALRYTWGHEDFWTELIRWLLRHPEVPPRRYEAVVEWLDAQRHQPPAGGGAPLQPRLTLRGRSPAAVLAAAGRWEREEWDAGPQPELRWTAPPACGPWTWLQEDGDDLVELRLVPLTSTAALLDEGRRMKHCVGGYSSACAEGSAVILSLRETRLLLPGRRRLATVEVRGDEVVQVRAKCNEPPSAAAFVALARWARERGLRFDREDLE